MKNLLKILKRSHRNLYSIILGTAIVLYWRGIWGIFDLYFFPNNELLSYVLSAILGIFLLWINDSRLKEIED